MKCYFCKRKLTYPLVSNANYGSINFAPNIGYTKKYQCSKYIKRKVTLTEIKPVKIIKI